MNTWSTCTRLSSYCSSSSCTVRRPFSISSPSFLQDPVIFGGLFWLPAQVHSSVRFTKFNSSTLSVWLAPVRCRRMHSSDRADTIWWQIKCDVSPPDGLMLWSNYLSERRSLHLLAGDWWEPVAGDLGQVSLTGKQIITWTYTHTCMPAWLTCDITDSIYGKEHDAYYEKRNKKVVNLGAAKGL